MFSWCLIIENKNLEVSSLSNQLIFLNLQPNFKMMKTRFLMIFILLLLLPVAAEAQCSMCRAVLESGGDQSAAEGINNGILYLMMFPYLLIGGIGFFIYRSRKKAKNE